ncbi:PREDICTED: carcinoembryonic antigen-related cell adhesion molecule 18 [Bison bison bison]|uniref:Carcinoembryonic antigen-related cell adhesion molecule 18 n=1 Tax=Bison bison bison TaxID=43346 RepID=A0A6P3HZY2_BISBB|nr:PREDICTED: carcinoembryonic antigen-related cell adhesion molecule 18 [Bison bison bison]
MDLSRPRCRLWRELVLVASLLACGIRQASSQIYITPDSLIGVERYSSSLAIENAPEDVQEYSWHRGANDTEENLIISYNATSHSRRDGPMYSGRESVSIRGTLRIWRSQLNDTGNYTVRVDTINDTQRATGWLEILELEIPQISVNTTSVVDGEDAVAATCYTNDSHVQWYVNHAPVSSNYRMTISPDNKTLVIRMFSRFDSPLQCGIEILPEFIQKSDLVYVTVAYGPYSLQLRSSPTDFSGILSAEIGSQVEMECISYSRPESKYRWIHNGSLLSFSEKNITLPSLTWDQMGRYRCIAENSATQLTLYDEVHIQAPCECRRGHRPVVSRSFTISGSLLVFLIIFTVLGFTHFLMVLIRALFRHYSTRPGGTIREAAKMPHLSIASDRELEPQRMSDECHALNHTPHILISETLEPGHPRNLTCPVPWVCEVTSPGAEVSTARIVHLNVSYFPLNLTVTIVQENGTVIRDPLVDEPSSPSPFSAPRTTVPSKKQNADGPSESPSRFSSPLHTHFPQ